MHRVHVTGSWYPSIATPGPARPRDLVVEAELVVQLKVAKAGAPNPAQ